MSDLAGSQAPAQGSPMTQATSTPKVSHATSNQPLLGICLVGTVLRPMNSAGLWRIGSIGLPSEPYLGMGQNQTTRGPFWSMFPFTRISFWVHIFDPQPSFGGVPLPRSFMGGGG